MREDLEAVLELYGGMPPGGQKHWRERALPSVEFESNAEREEFVAALQQLEKQPVKSTPSAAPVAGPARTYAPGQRVKANLGGLSAGGVQFSQNVEAAYAVVTGEVSADPLVYRLKLLASFHGVTEVDVPAQRIRPM